MKIYRLALFILLCCAVTSCTAQTKPTGKTYTAEVAATCKDGVGMIWIYCVLEFTKDSVTISYRVEESVIEARKGTYVHMYDHLKKTCRWKSTDNRLTIEHCNEFRNWKLQESTITAENSEKKQIVFTEEKK